MDDLLTGLLPWIESANMDASARPPMPVPKLANKVRRLTDLFMFPLFHITCVKPGLVDKYEFIGAQEHLAKIGDRTMFCFFRIVRGSRVRINFLLVLPSL